VGPSVTAWIRNTQVLKRTEQTGAVKRTFAKAQTHKNIRTRCYLSTRVSSGIGEACSVHMFRRQSELQDHRTHRLAGRHDNIDIAPSKHGVNFPKRSINGSAMGFRHCYKRVTRLEQRETLTLSHSHPVSTDCNATNFNMTAHTIALILVLFSTKLACPSREKLPLFMFK
jgi:hypothetical protein